MSAYTEDNLVQKTTADYLHDTLGWDESIYAMQDCLGIKADGVFLLGRTSTRSVRRSLERLSGASKIAYRGSKRTGGWYMRT